MKVGKTYLISIEVGERALTFTGKIISIDDNFVTFIDKFGKELHYNLKNIISFEEVKDAKTTT